jgi:hypothetical protein
MCQIEFHVTAAVLSQIPHPYPAARHIPDWFKNMPADHDCGGTLKRCPPFLTAMAAGYIIPAPADAQFKMSPDGVLSAYGTISFFSTHFPQQYAGAPFTNKRVVKFHNPWIIVTPPEYVCLITAPINRFEIPFLPLTGIVETGAYYKEVQLPMACLMEPGQTFDLPRGAPMVQVIPMRREAWTSRTASLDPAHREEQQLLFNANPHTYKDRFWQKMQFS